MLPDELKLQLVDDWDKVARNGKVRPRPLHHSCTPRANKPGMLQIAKLRREVTIATVLKDFVTHIEPLGPRAASVASEVASGLKVRSVCRCSCAIPVHYVDWQGATPTTTSSSAQVYFNVHCGSTLLYDIERRQYKELREEFPDLDLTDA